VLSTSVFSECFECAQSNRNRQCHTEGEQLDITQLQFKVVKVKNLNLKSFRACLASGQQTIV